MAKTTARESKNSAPRNGESTSVSRTTYLLLDTNVWLNFYLGDRAGHDSATELIRLATTQAAELLYPVHASKDVYYVLSADVKRKAREAGGNEFEHEAAMAANALAWGCINNMGQLATAVPCSHADIWLATKQRDLHSDFEDDLVIAAAMNAKADLLVTDDEQLRAHAPVPTLSVGDAIKWLKARE